jgi:hypothetical protein
VLRVVVASLAFLALAVAIWLPKPAAFKTSNGSLKPSWYYERLGNRDPFEVGPLIGPGRKLLSKPTSAYAFSPNDLSAVYADGTAVVALSLRPEPAEPFQPTEIARLERVPTRIHVVSEGGSLLVQEGGKREGGAARLWWIDGSTKVRKLLSNNQESAELAESPVSSDDRFVAIRRQSHDGAGRFSAKRLHFIDRTTGKTVAADLQVNDAEVVRWHTTHLGLRAVVASNRWPSDPKTTALFYWVDPETGAAELQRNLDDGHSETRSVLSPDGRFRAAIEKNRLTLIDLGTGEHRSATIPTEDLAYVGPDCLRWANAWQLQFHGARIAFIDEWRAKITYPAPAEQAAAIPNSYRFSPQLEWMLYLGEGGTGLYLAPVKTPSNPS